MWTRGAASQTEPWPSTWIRSGSADSASFATPRPPSESVRSSTGRRCSTPGMRCSCLEPRRVVPWYAVPPGDLQMDLTEHDPCSAAGSAGAGAAAPPRRVAHGAGSVTPSGRPRRGRLPARRARAGRPRGAALGAVRVVGGGRAGRRPPPRSLQADRRAAQQPPRARRGRRRLSGRVVPDHDAHRDGAAGAVVPATSGRPDGPAHAVGDSHGVRVQGRRLLPQRRGRPRCGVVLPRAVARCAARQGPRSASGGPRRSSVDGVSVDTSMPGT